MEHKITPEEMSDEEIVLVGKLRRVKSKLLREPVSEDTLMMIEDPNEWRWQKWMECDKL